ncbi:MAG: hypothetical protein M0D55_14450 [Elusimicrobiota bacterium]|nr:MAG: hypothetical protein M0D55_14450 [Elusimicrobiota bacterium]
MSSMELYVKFMFTLAVGLVGVGMVLKTLLETLLHEWDAVREANLAWDSLFRARHPYAESVRAEDILMELEGGSKNHPRRDADVPRAGPVVTYY